MRIITKSVAVTTTGTDGTATGSATLDGMDGFLLDVYFDFDATCTSTTDTTIAYTTQGGNLLVITSSATDVLIAPRQKLVDNANGGITNSHAMFPMNQALTISLAESDVLDPAVTVYFRILILD